MRPAPAAPRPAGRTGRARARPKARSGGRAPRRRARPSAPRQSRWPASRIPRRPTRPPVPTVAMRRWPPAPTAPPAGPLPAAPGRPRPRRWPPPREVPRPRPPTGSNAEPPPAGPWPNRPHRGATRPRRRTPDGPAVARRSATRCRARHGRDGGRVGGSGGDTQLTLCPDPRFSADVSSGHRRQYVDEVHEVQKRSPRGGGGSRPGPGRLWH